MKCKCGTWTEFGMTCVNCRDSLYNLPVDKEIEEEESEDKEEEPKPQNDTDSP